MSTGLGRSATFHEGESNAGRVTGTRRGFLRVAGWSYGMNAGHQVVSLVLGFILAALLGPEAYGVVAMALLFVLFIDLLQQQGLASAIVQRKALRKDHLDAAFWMVVGVSVLGVAVCVLLAGLWARLNQTPELAPVILGLTALLPVRALGTVQEALLRREMQFKQLTVRTLSGVGLGGVAGIVAAFAGLGVWALVLQQLTGALVSLVLVWWLSGWRPSFSFSPSAARELLGFSTGSFMSSIGVFVNNMADVLVVGLFFGPVVVGLYRFSARLVETLESLASRPVRSMALPELSPWQDDPARLAERVTRLTRLAALLALPLMGVLFASAGVILRQLGPEWEPAITAARLLCVVGAVRAVVVVDGPLLGAVGRPHFMAMLTWLMASVSVGTFVAGAVVLRRLPEVGAATGIAGVRATLYASTLLLIHVMVMRRFAALSMRQIITAPLVPLAAGLSAAAVGLVVEYLVSGHVSAVFELVLVGASAALGAAAVLCCDGRVRQLFAAVLKGTRLRAAIKV